jgi:hypothetical protein
MDRDLLLCRSDFERANARAIGGKEIREAAEVFAKRRNLTPGELAIAEEFGYKG